MSENTNDLYMQWNTTLGATHTSIFLAVGLAKGVISLVHFLSKLHQDKLLKGGEVENFASFLKVTKGDYNIERVPLAVNGNAEEDIAKVKQAMDSAGIRYCMLPDFNGDGPEKSAYIAVYEKDQQKFAEVFMNHVKNVFCIRVNPHAEKPEQIAARRGVLKVRNRCEAPRLHFLGTASQPSRILAVFNLSN